MGDEIPRDLLNELIIRIEQVENRQAALEGAIHAFIVVFGIRRLPDQPEGGAPHDQR